MQSNSIVNQRKLIEQYISQNNDLQLVNFYIDDGFSGTNFNRPEFKRLLQDIKNKVINCIIVKDLSRFARNHIEADTYFENIFPALNIRFISVIENIDSYENPESLDNLIVPSKNLLNDAYAKDISKKVKTTLIAKKKNGEFVGSCAPYGYKKSKNNIHKFEKDIEASYNVLLIFNNVLKGKTPMEIANELNNRKILTPALYKQHKGLGNYSQNINGKWNAKIVNKILKNRTYIGELIQGKRKVENYRTHKLINTKQEEWIITEKHHEAIISEEKFNKVQELMKKNKSKINKDGKTDLFYGFLECGDCHSKLKKSGEYYYCESYARYKKCTKHSINRNKIINKLKEETENNEVNKELLINLINKIIIFDDGNIKIDYKN